MQISYDPHPTAEDSAILLHGINELNPKGVSPLRSFTFFLKDPAICGGIQGALLHGALYIDMLWVHSAYRGQDWGSKLVTQAEQYGREHGCNFAVVNTMSWEALPFYQKLGYHVEFTREGFENKSKMYFLRKNNLL